MLRRRRFLSLTAAAVVAGCGTVRPRLAGDPFTLGIASGEPSPDGFVLWTRLALDPLAGGGMPDVPVDTVWRVAEDANFVRTVATGVARAEPAWAHSVHAEVTGLAPGRWYFYRFELPEGNSETGRARTAPAPGDAAGKLRFAFGSCQRYEAGFYAALRHAAGASADLFVHLGDYIYENGLRQGRGAARSFESPAATTLALYRNRYAIYKSDPDLRAAHAACPWLVTWDDHEVQNDYAADRSETDPSPARFLARRAAAYRAYYEHMPLRAAQRPAGADMRLHRSVAFGELAAFHMLDERQYRTPQACPPANRPGGGNVVGRECEARADEARTMLGAAQERWIAPTLASGGVRWNVVAQQTLMAPARMADDKFRTDGWDGYPAARQRLVRAFAAPGVSNPVVLSGDVHAFHAAELHATPEDPASPAVATEFCGGSIASGGPAQDHIDMLCRANPHLLYGRSDVRGYALADLDPGQLTMRFFAVDNVRDANSPVRPLATFEVDAGSPRVRVR